MWPIMTAIMSGFLLWRFIQKLLIEPCFVAKDTVKTLEHYLLREEMKSKMFPKRESGSGSTTLDDPSYAGLIRHPTSIRSFFLQTTICVWIVSYPGQKWVLNVYTYVSNRDRPVGLCSRHPTLVLVHHKNLLTP